ncbi:hypothetical protein DKP76_11555 [Falsochrobactrum shanghaiense]|uniref:Uncharacterized protein n=1 Tax=Falsochrobactrum shanghaiense TaxID=2201899 RepID=A0A316J6C1_9HYPH|nr:hypothetical protein [Falsochrobactrum shanghaiense]PWL17407.1 hypothetical protein DKP76_11555 [Falsochrobactrum shanghaiense]
MARYFSLRCRPKMDWGEANALDSLSREVFDPEPVDTGIIDADGFPIIRMMDQIGFVRDEDR